MTTFYGKQLIDFRPRSEKWNNSNGLNDSDVNEKQYRKRKSAFFMIRPGKDLVSGYSQSVSYTECIPIQSMNINEQNIILMQIILDAVWCFNERIIIKL